MKKILFLFAALLQTAIVMAQNPAKQQMPQQLPFFNNLQPGLKNMPANKANRPWVITGENEGNLRQNRGPFPPGPNSPAPIILIQQK